MLSENGARSQSLESSMIHHYYTKQVFESKEFIDNEVSIMPFLKNPPSELLRDLPEEQQVLVAGGVSDQTYSHEETTEEYVVTCSEDDESGCSGEDTGPLSAIPYLMPRVNSHRIAPKMFSSPSRFI